jgi:hypothetical protein
MTRKTNLTLAALALTSLLAAAAQAGTHPNERRGWIVGFDIGTGTSLVKYDRPVGNYESDDDEIGGSFGIRVGYGLSDRFTLTLDSNGFGLEDDDWETGIGTTVAMATYHFGGGGFFLRAGAGIGRIETTLPDDLTGSPAVEIKKNGPVAAFGLGYEWRVGQKFGLGLALDSRGGAIEDFDDLTDISFTKSTVGLQFNWYL